MLPEGLTYVEDFVSDAEDRALLDALDGIELRTLTMRGQTARRTVRHFGLDYDYESGQLVPADPLPPQMEDLRERCAALIEREPEDLVQILVSRYPEGAGIGWHRDAPMFGSRIAGVSLLAPCRMRFQRTVKGERETAAIELAQVLVTRYPPGATIGWHRDAPTFGTIVGVSLLASCRMRFQRTVGATRRVAAIDLAPRSAYLLAGKARWSWQHSIPATKALRHSVTFRTLKRG